MTRAELEAYHEVEAREFPGGRWVTGHVFHWDGSMRPYRRYERPHVPEMDHIFPLKQIVDRTKWPFCAGRR